MLPWMPRKRGPDGKLWCKNCHEGRPGRPRAQASLMDQPGLMGQPWGSLHCANCGAPMGEAGLIVKNASLVCAQGCEKTAEMYEHASRLAEATPYSIYDPLSDALKIEAHDSGDGETIYHCPFCGGGQVIGRGDGTTSCEFCHKSFTVQVQPEIAAMPQTINGQPQQMPGMPGGPPSPSAPFDQDQPDGGQNAAQPPGAPAAAFVPPGGAGAGSDAFQPPQKKTSSLTDQWRIENGIHILDLGILQANVFPSPPNAINVWSWSIGWRAGPKGGQVIVSGYGANPEEAKRKAENKLIIASMDVDEQQWKAKEGFYIGPEGAVMGERSFIHHLALRFADDRDVVLADIQEANSR